MTAQGPTSSAAIDVRRAYALLEAGDVEGAIPFLEAGIKAYPTNLSLLVNYANCLADAGMSPIIQSVSCISSGSVAIAAAEVTLSG